MSQITNPDPDLMRIFNFTADDLEANRSGKMSERQTKQLKDASDADRFAVNCAIWIGLIIAGIVVFALIVSPHSITGGKTDPLDSIYWIPIFLLLAFLFMRYRSNQRSNEIAIDSQRAGSVEGLATLHTYVPQGNRYPIYQIIVDGKSFQIEKQCYKDFEVFIQLKNKYAVFRIYFAPEISKILSVEIIGQ